MQRKNCSPVRFRSRVLFLLRRHPTTRSPHFLRRFPHLNRLTDRCRPKYARPFHCRAPDRTVHDTLLWVVGDAVAPNGQGQSILNASGCGRLE
jgi:hypothetical protein